jgi:hypothetical protein
VDAHADHLVQRLLRQPLRLRVGADQEPGRRVPVDARWTAPPNVPDAHDRGQDEQDHHAHDRHRADPGSRPTADLRALRRDPTPSTTPSPARGTSSPTATWARTRGCSAPRCPAADLAGPRPARRSRLIDARTSRAQARDPRAGLTVPQLVKAAWASASTYRDSDKRGGANGARIRLAPQKGGRSTSPSSSPRRSPRARAIQERVQRLPGGGKRVSMADLIVLGGCAAVEEPRRKAGHDVTVPFTPGAPTRRPR